MHVAVLGAGAVGSVLGSLLWRAGEDVVLVGRAAHVAAIRSAGLSVQGVLGGFRATPHAEERLRAKPDLVLLTVKTQDVVQALRENAQFLEGVPIVVLQNGLQAEALAATAVPAAQLISGIVALHAQYLTAGHVLLMQADGLLIGRPDGHPDATVERVRAVLDKAVPTSVSANILGARWTKLIVNLNNVVPALCDVSFKEAYRIPALRRLALGMMREGIVVGTRAGVRFESLPGTSVTLVKLAAVMPALLAGEVAARKAAKLETRWPLKGSTWQSLARGRSHEADYLNGEVVRLGRSLGVPTPLNARALALLEQVAARGGHLTVREVEQALERQSATPPREGRAPAS
jgi:2-dehydropantoate 2-reductase